MQQNPKDGFEVVKQVKAELDQLILARNELAKWQLLNTEKAENCSKQKETSENFKIINLPPMVTNRKECEYCFAKSYCLLSASSLESDSSLPSSYQVKPEVQHYFKKFYECIALEQSFAIHDKTQFEECHLKLVSAYSDGSKGTIVTLQKVIDDETVEFSENTFVTMTTEQNISFIKGCIIMRSYIARYVSPKSPFKH
jgi:hypothetical protein